MFARRLRELRQEHGWSQAALAERLSRAGLKLDDLAILRIEKHADGPEGARRVRLGEATVIAKTLGVRLEEMLRDTRGTDTRLEQARAIQAAAHAEFVAVTDTFDQVQKRYEAAEAAFTRAQQVVEELEAEQKQTAQAVRAAGHAATLWAGDQHKRRKETDDGER
jgi:transcriptional regulator with XRE-family HTH domain